MLDCPKKALQVHCSYYDRALARSTPSSTLACFHGLWWGGFGWLHGLIWYGHPPPNPPPVEGGRAIYDPRGRQHSTTQACVVDKRHPVVGRPLLRRPPNPPCSAAPPTPPMLAHVIPRPALWPARDLCVSWMCPAPPVHSAWCPHRPLGASKRYSCCIGSGGAGRAAWVWVVQCDCDCRGRRRFRRRPRKESRHSLANAGKDVRCHDIARRRICLRAEGRRRTNTTSNVITWFY